jgi:hypothetical protein
MLARQGQWVLIEQIFLTAGRRQEKIPHDTQMTDFRLRIKGFLLDEKCVVGDNCFIQTKTGRTIQGMLVDIMPDYHHSFGDYLPETEYIEQQLRELLKGEFYE